MAGAGEVVLLVVTMLSFVTAAVLALWPRQSTFAPTYKVATVSRCVPVGREHVTVDMTFK